MDDGTVVLEALGSGWLAHDAAGPVGFLPGPPASAATETLQRYARETVSSTLPNAYRLVLLSPRCDGVPHISAGNARTVLLTSRTLALAELAPADWTRFLVLDLGEQRYAAFITRVDGTCREESLAGMEPARIADLLRMLALQHVFVHGDSASVDAYNQELLEHSGAGLAPASNSDPRAPITGAFALAHAARAKAGVWQMAPGQLRVAARRDACYTIYRPDRHVFSPEENTLSEIAAGHPVFLVLDQEIDLLYGTAIRRYGGERLQVAGQVTLSGREDEKTLGAVEDICSAAYNAGLRRDGIIVAVGGGVTQDLAGFAAAVFRRGVGFVRIPTTLIGLVDVAIGVKQAANAFGAKNLLGAFYPPLASILDYTLLETLPAPALSAGFAEILKMAVICDEALLRDVEGVGPSLIASKFRAPQDAGRRIAERAELLMAEQLAVNLFEEDLARAVDFGHTFSPVIETASRYRISHGEAVAIDMLLSTSIAAQRGLCDPGLLNRLAKVTAALSLPLWPDGMPTVPQLEGSLAAARRHRGGALNLVVPVRAGAVTYLQDVAARELERAVCDLQLAAASPFVSVPYPAVHSPGIERHARLGV